MITNEEFNDTLTEISLRSKRRVWRYGHDAVAGSSPGYLNTPDDAYRLPNGDTTIADIRNCRIVELTPRKRVRRILGGSCVHDPPRGFASPNGDTPLPDGGLLVTEIGGWIDRLDARTEASSGRFAHRRISVGRATPPERARARLGLHTAGRDRGADPVGSGHVEVRSAGGADELNKPSLAVRLPNGLIAANDDWNHRVIIVDPRTNRIVWQYGHTGVAGLARATSTSRTDSTCFPRSCLRLGARRAS